MTHLDGLKQSQEGVPITKVLPPLELFEDFLVQVLHLPSTVATPVLFSHNAPKDHKLLPRSEDILGSFSSKGDICE